MATQVASLFGTLEIRDQATSALKGFRSAFSDAGNALKGLSDGFKGFGAIASIGITGPILGFLAASVQAASNTQTALAQLDAVLKSTGDTAETASVQAGHWATRTADMSPKAQKLRDELQLLNAKLYDNESRYASAKGPHQALGVEIDQEREKIAKLTAELGDNAVGTKYWVDAASQMTSVSHMSRDALIQMAYSLEDVTRYSHDSVLGTESLLLTFTNIGKDVFPQATKTVLDMSTALGQDTKSAAIELGKALQDPVVGLTALKRVGVEFTNQQKEQIKALAASGDMMGAQKMILAELSKEFGGSAEAAGDTFAGKLDIAKNKIGDFMMTVGDQLLPILSSFFDSLTQVMSGVDNLDPSFIQIGIVAGIAAAAIGPLSTAIGVLLGPIGLVIAGVAALAAAWQSNFGGIQTIVAGLYNEVKPKLDGLVGLVKDFWNDLFPKDMGTQNEALASSMEAMGRIPAGFQGPQNAAAVPFIDRLIESLKSSAPKIQDAIKSIISDAVSWLTTTGYADFTSAMQTAFGIDPGIFNGIINLFGSVWSGTVKPILDSFSQGIQGFIQNISGADWSGVAKILAIIGGALSAFAVGVAAVAGGALKGIADALPGLGTGLKDIVDALAAYGKGDLQGGFDGLSKGISQLGQALLNIPMDIAGKLLGLFNININSALQPWKDIAAQLPVILQSLFAPGGPIDSAIQPFKDGWNNLFGSGGAIDTAIQQGKGFIQQFFSKISEIGGVIGTAVAGIGHTLMQPFRDGVKDIGDLLISVAAAGGPFLGLADIGAKLVAAAGKATGGAVFGNMPYLVGEQGPELFVPNGSGTIVPNHQLLSSGGGNSGIQSLTINQLVLQGVQDVHSLYQQLENVAKSNNMSLGVQRA